MDRALWNPPPSTKQACNNQRTPAPHATHDCTLWRCSERRRRRSPPSPAVWPWPQYVRTTTQNSGLGSRPVRPVSLLYTAQRWTAADGGVSGGRRRVVAAGGRRVQLALAPRLLVPPATSRIHPALTLGPVGALLAPLGGLGRRSRRQKQEKGRQQPRSATGHHPRSKQCLRHCHGGACPPKRSLKCHRCCLPPLCLAGRMDQKG